MKVSSEPKFAEIELESAIRGEIERVVGEQVPELVHQAVSKEEERRFRQLKWIAAFISVVGLGTFGTLATFMVEKVVEAKAGSIRETLELTRINGLALKLNIGKSFSRNDRDEAIALLNRIAKSPAVRSSQDVRSALGDILKSFTSAGLEAEVDQLFVTFQDEVISDGLSSGRSAKPRSDRSVSRPAGFAFHDAGER